MHPAHDKERQGDAQKHPASEDTHLHRGPSRLRAAQGKALCVYLSFLRVFHVSECRL